jgi:hypothetical protein
VLWESLESRGSLGGVAGVSGESRGSQINRVGAAGVTREATESTESLKSRGSLGGVVGESNKSRRCCGSHSRVAGVKRSQKSKSVTWLVRLSRFKSRVPFHTAICAQKDAPPPLQHDATIQTQTNTKAILLSTSCKGTFSLTTTWQLRKPGVGRVGRTRRANQKNVK